MAHIIKDAVGSTNPIPGFGSTTKPVFPPVAPASGWSIVKSFTDFLIPAKGGTSMISVAACLFELRYLRPGVRSRYYGVGVEWAGNSDLAHAPEAGSPVMPYYYVARDQGHCYHIFTGTAVR